MTDDTPPDPLAALIAEMDEAIREASTNPASTGWCIDTLNVIRDRAATLAARPSGDEAPDVERLAQAIQNIDFAADLPASGHRTVTDGTRRRATRYAREYAALAAPVSPSPDPMGYTPASGDDSEDWR